MSPFQKSKSIKIKKSRNSEEDTYSLTGYSNDRMYDWATWRMYHRITSARRSRTDVISTQQDQHAFSDEESSSLSFRNVPSFPMDDGTTVEGVHVMPFNLHSEPTLHPHADTYEDEVFVLEI